MCAQAFIIPTVSTILRKNKLKVKMQITAADIKSHGLTDDSNGFPSLRDSTPGAYYPNNLALTWECCFDIY